MVYCVAAIAERIKRRTRYIGAGRNRYEPGGGDEVCGVWDDGVAIDLEDWMERGNIDARDDGELGELSSPAKLSISTITRQQSINRQELYKL